MTGTIHGVIRIYVQHGYGDNALKNKKSIIKKMKRIVNNTIVDQITSTDDREEMVVFFNEKKQPQVVLYIGTGTYIISIPALHFWHGIPMTPSPVRPHQWFELISKYPLLGVKQRNKPKR